MFPAANITYLSEVLIRDGISDDHVLRNEYGWFPKISLLEELTEIYEDYCEKTNHKTRKIDVVKTFLKVHDKIVKIAELLLTFFVFEALNRVAGNQVQFQMIDLRLVYIVLFSSLYGINYGLQQRGWKHFHCWQHIRKPGSAGRHFSTNLRTGFRLSSIL